MLFLADTCPFKLLASVVLMAKLYRNITRTHSEIPPFISKSCAGETQNNPRGHLLTVITKNLSINHAKNPSELLAEFTMKKHH